MPTDFWGNALFSLVPTVLFGLVFALVIRSIVRADRNERRAYAKVEAEERLKAGQPAPASAGAGPAATPEA